MADPKFDYPNAASPTLTLTFASPSKAELKDDAPSLTFNQQASESRGGTDFVESFGDPKDTLSCSIIVPITAAASEPDFDDLRTFLVTINGAVNSFVWTDANSVARTVKCMTNPIQFSRFAKGFYITTLMLKVVG